MNNCIPSAQPFLGHCLCSYQSSIGIDVHSQTLVACFQNNEVEAGAVHSEIKSFKTTYSGLNEFSQWCRQKNPQVVLMESTGVLWRSPYEKLEDAGFAQQQLILVNARSVKVPRGRKTDASDAEHLATIARIGAFNNSFVPCRDIRDARSISRMAQTAKNDIVRAKNQFHKSLNSIGCRASMVFSDIHGKSGKAIIHSLLWEDEASLKISVAKNSKLLKSSPEEILDALQPIRRNSNIIDMLKIQFGHIEDCEQRHQKLLFLLEQILKPYRHHLNLLKTIPGIKESSALHILAEIGPDLSLFANIERFASWIGICPGNQKSAGINKNGKIPYGNKWLRKTLVEVAGGIALMKKDRNFLWQKFQVLKEKHGRNKAVVAVAHLVARIIYVLFTRDVPYAENPEEILRLKRISDLQRTVIQAGREGISVKQEGIIDDRSGLVIIDADKLTRIAKSFSRRFSFSI